ncbi:MAG: hypothetical protein UT86_C0001G0089 [Candidatus Magasanikbacteria bacterium GW2011_GWC2_40_17]|uniref:Methyltransferase domain-containing protein n=1 Tax=Candidatus Magasanikbacteria bacterium GW2011_GWA2_42_32 TaxID=1619039 RepID=A0A0G1A922_9BACT|nr:MAG: hypothetical protein UT86_C0001G0089 [Candidatus Magasanikbacteria bacterium GW2011_GWC2_40_17]KKS57449.1 MAG: hypothetical protein UV20_C0001G0089 [Candidatus Magasanikbacteria bacterium GW2011_GWA2_42_32]
MDLRSAKKILKKVEKDYNIIAKEWSLTRSRPRAYQIAMTKRIKKGDKVLDLGCGNAVLYEILAGKSIDYVGLDVSSKLLNLAKKNISSVKKNGERARLIKGDIVDLPFSKNQFDWVLSLAVLHHIPSRELQKKSAEEIYKILKPGGRIVISVWNLHTVYAREKFKLNDFNLLRPRGWEKNDFLTPWKATLKKIIQRYIYRFNKKELYDLFAKAGFKKIKVGYGDKNGEWTKSLNKSYNIILEAEK